MYNQGINVVTFAFKMFFCSASKITIIPAGTVGSVKPKFFNTVLETIEKHHVF